MATQSSVAFHTLGCKLNFSETSSISRLFEEKGFVIEKFHKSADIYVINTCSVTDFADKKCRQVVRQVLRQNPSAKVIVTGCYAQLKPQEIADIPGVDLVLGAAEKFRMLEYIDILQMNSDKGLVFADDINDANSFVSSFSFGDRTRTFLKVQDGCDYKCSFCTIPLARGKSRSNTVANVLEHAIEIAQKGSKEIVLTGVNLGDFGKGTEVIEGSKPKKEALFFDLIKELDNIEGIERFRISSIEPNLLTNEIIHFVAGSKRFVPHFHIPLQSGSDKILKLMRRRYNRKLYTSRIDQIKKLMPHACIGVDVIVGFPGETKEDFLETYQYLNMLDISYLHVFTYSERNNTLAVEMSEIVIMEERRRRNEMLRILSEKKKRSFYQKFIGTEQFVLFEAHKDSTLITGFTENYLKIEIASDGIQPNSIGKVLLSGFNSDGELKATRVFSSVNEEVYSIVI